VCNFGIKKEKRRGGNTSAIFEEGGAFKYRSTGHIFEVKKRTDQFEIFQSLDGLTYVLTEEKSIFRFFEKALRAGTKMIVAIWTRKRHRKKRMKGFIGNAKTKRKKRKEKI